MRLPPTLAAGAAVAVGLLANGAYGLVNPSLQPGDLYDRHRVVLNLKVTAIDDGKQQVELAVVRVCKGEFAPKKVGLTLNNDQVQGAFQVLPRQGLTVVAFVGSTVRGNDREIVFYAGGEGRWQVGDWAADDPSRWRWTKDLNNQEMYGTFNGSEDRLAEMMADASAGRYFFPAQPFDQFKDDLVIDRFEKPIRGTALYDIDGDGKLDIYACCETGNRAYLQDAKGKFADATAALGLAGVKSVSCNFADVSGSGRADLLADGVIYQQSADHKFARTDLLPAEADQKVRCSAFVDWSGDGYPDVVVSRLQGGLHVYLNPGAKGGAFIDATHDMGLDTKECGADQTGFFLFGDWSGDGRAALFYSVGGGLLLVQDQKGRLAPLEPRMQFDFQTDGKDTGLTGAGCFAPVWRQDRPDVVFSRDAGVNILANVDGKPFDAAQYGNELVVACMSCLPVLAEDLNADGYVDLYAGSRSAVLPNVYYMNRGYGSFVVPTRYKQGVFPGKAHQVGAWGLAAGDSNGDGANDLLLGGVDGVLTLLVNDTLSLRQARENPTRQEKKLEQTSIVTVRVSGRLGVLGAKVTLADAKQGVLARRDIGANIATGCRGPDTVNLAVREPGPYVVAVRYSDGLVGTWPADVTKERHVTVEAKREGASAKAGR